MRTKLHEILAIAGIAALGAGMGVANAAATGGTSGGASTSGTTAGASTTTPATPATPASPAQDTGPATINPPGGDDGAGLSIKDPNSASGANANVNQRGNSATAKATGTLDFGIVDKNTDGAITKAEAQASKNKEFSKAFDQLDANRDGRLDNAEFAQFSVGGTVTTPATPSSSSLEPKTDKKK